MIIFKLNEKNYECVQLPFACNVLYDGDDKSYFLLVDDKSLYSAKSDNNGIFHFEYIKDVDVEFKNEKIHHNYLLREK